MKFAKLFDYEDGSQILVKNDDNEKGKPEVRFFFKPNGLGICSTALSFDDSESGCDSADSLFNSTTKQTALDFVNKVLGSAGL